MELDSFNLLSNEEKRNLLLKQGVILGRRTYNEFKTTLFAMEGFYVEVLYNTKTKNTPCMRCSDKLDFLDPYLESIDITALYA